MTEIKFKKWNQKRIRENIICTTLIKSKVYYGVKNEKEEEYDGIELKFKGQLYEWNKDDFFLIEVYRNGGLYPYGNPSPFCFCNRKAFTWKFAKSLLDD